MYNGTLDIRTWPQEPSEFVLWPKPVPVLFGLVGLKTLGLPVAALQQLTADYCCQARSSNGRLSHSLLREEPNHTVV